MNLTNKSILVTGATGSFGTAFVNYVLNSSHKPKKLIIFSRDELKQFEMEKKFQSLKNFNILRFFIGDIRDKDRLKTALEGVDIVIHAAALKQVPTAEYNPFEAIKTNIIGTQNLIEASIEKKVKKVISLSTDKAASPINLYGATKLCADKLMISANNIKGKNPITFSVVRYGNVLGSRGSVLPLFINQAKKKTFTITDKKMTRFNISLKKAVEMVIWSIKNCVGEEIVVPKIPSYNIMTLAKAISPKAKFKFTGIRSGEKIHEELITKSDSQNTYDIGSYYLILPNNNKKILHRFKKKKSNPRKVKEGFYYSSDNNKKFLSVKELKIEIKKSLNY